MSSAPLVSIITVVRNDAANLLRTIQSIAPYKNDRVEYVIVDGASTDDTLKVAELHREMIDVLVSEPDKGIYDAMNKGIDLAHGKFLLFLNAGDELTAELTAMVDMAPENSVLIYGKTTMINPDGTFDYIKGKRLKSIQRFLKGMPLCHQAILYRREVIGHYDIDFKVMSDRVLTYNILNKHGLKRTYFVDQIMATYYQGGISGNYGDEFLAAEAEKFFRSVGKTHYIYIKQFNFIFKHKLKLPLLNFIRKLTGTNS